MLSLLQDDVISGWVVWFENHGPLWIISLGVFAFLARLGLIILKWAPIAFESHIRMLTVATDSMKKSADSFNVINDKIDDGIRDMNKNHTAFWNAIHPLGKAIVAAARPESKEEVRGYVDQMIGEFKKDMNTGVLVPVRARPHD